MRRCPRVPDRENQNAVRKAHGTTQMNARQRSRSAPKVDRDQARLRPASSRTERERAVLEREISEMEAKLADESNLTRQIKTLKVRKAELTKELRERKDASTSRSEEVSELDELHRRFDTLSLGTSRLEDELVRAVAMNVALVERMGRDKGVDDYQKNQSLRLQYEKAAARMHEAAKDLAIESALVNQDCGSLSRKMRVEDVRDEYVRAETMDAEVRDRIKKMKELRTTKLKEMVTKSVEESFAAVDREAAELKRLHVRLRELELEQEEGKRVVGKAEIIVSVEEARNELHTLRQMLCNKQLAVFNARADEIQLQHEVERANARMKTLAELKDLEKQRERVRTRFLGLQELYNERLSSNGPIDEPREMIDLEAQFAEVESLKHAKRSDEAGLESVSLRDESYRLEGLVTDIKQWMRLRAASRVLTDARSKSLAVHVRHLKSPREAILSEELDSCRRVVSSYRTTLARLHSVNVALLGGPEDTESLETLFSSITARISCLLELGDHPAPLDVTERKLLQSVSSRKKRTV